MKERLLKIASLMMAVTLAAFMAVSVCACSSGSNDDQLQTVDDMRGKILGVDTGSALIDVSTELAGPNGKVEYFNNIGDRIAALTTGKIDGFGNDGPVAECLVNERDDLRILDGYLLEMEYGFIFPKKGQQAGIVESQMNEYITKLTNNGEIAKLEKKWWTGSESDRVVDMSGLTGENGTVKIAVNPTIGKPGLYLNNNEYCGEDIDIIIGFCREYGYRPDFFNTDFNGVLAAVTSGKCVIGAAYITITDERKKSVDFSVPYYKGGAVIVVRNSAGHKEGLVTSAKNSFKRTFLEEKRWQLFAQGIANTVIITVLSILLGTLLGFGTYMMCRRYGKLANRFVDFCVWLVGGMPTVVLLMVLFYLVFAAVDIDSTVVAVIAFTLVFASSVIGMLRVGVSSVDPGQEEAAKAMGYSPRKAFTRIVLPQAVLHIFPTYKSEIISLLKATAVVGYIAVQDLTKMGDVIRSATYEAFFPLIAVAVVYFVLEALLNLIANAVERRIDPRHGKKQR